MNSLIQWVVKKGQQLSELKPVRAVIDFLEKYKIIPKIFCLIISVVFWVYVDNKQIAEIRLRVPINVDISNEYAVADMEKKYMSVFVRGNSEDIRSVSPASIAVTVHVVNPNLNDNIRYPIIVKGRDIPDTVHLISEDQTIFMRVEKRIMKRVFISPKFEGSLDSGFIKGNVRIIPAEVDVYGAESVLEKIDQIETEPVSLLGQRASFERDMKLKTDSVLFGKVGQESARIIVPIYDSSLYTRIFVPVTVEGDNDSYSYESAVSKVEVFVRSDKSTEIPSPDDFQAYIDVKDSPEYGAEKGDHYPMGRLPVIVKIINGHNYETVVPDKIEVEARKK